MPNEAETRVNHYKFWRLGLQVRLQVEDTSWETPLGCIEFIGNPTIKNETPIVDASLHLTAYRILQPNQPPRTSESFANQFDGATWEIGESELLLVPAAKKIDPKQPSEPKAATHYVCYRVLHGPPVNRPVQLIDQFDQFRQTRENVDRLIPVFLGLPATKNNEQPAEPKILLAIYQITPTDTLGDPIRANARDQFGRHTLHAKESWMLAVPSWRLEG